MVATQKINFLTLVSYSLLQTVFLRGRTVLPQYKTLQTTTDDRRQSVPKARPIVRSAKNRSIFSEDMDKSIVSPFFDSWCSVPLHCYQNLTLPNVPTRCLLPGNQTTAAFATVWGLNGCRQGHGLSQTISFSVVNEIIRRPTFAKDFLRLFDRSFQET